MDSERAANAKQSEDDGSNGGAVAVPPPPVGLIYDERMCNHFQPGKQPHPECPQRIKVIWDLLQSSGISQRCKVLTAREAEDKCIGAVHSEKHVKLIRSIDTMQSDTKRRSAASKLDSIYFSKGSSEAAFLAAGSVIHIAEKVAKGELSAGFAIVRPPGHHAEHDKPMGFCLFNNVAVATNYLLNEKPELGIKKVLIVDWDVHHGNGTQKMFWNDPRVLFFSVHRFDFGTFYPACLDGSYDMVGEGAGAGYNVNVPWEHGNCGDSDYLAVWDHVLIPLAKSFNPDIILISAGFDAAIGDPLGGCCISPDGYSVMIKKLTNFAGGKIVLTLEGGYNLDSLAKSALACVEVLLGERVGTSSQGTSPFKSTWSVIEAVRSKLAPFWPVFLEPMPEKLLGGSSDSVLYEASYSSSDNEVDSDKSDTTASLTKPSAQVDHEVVNVIHAFSALVVNEVESDSTAPTNSLKDSSSMDNSLRCETHQAAPGQVGQLALWRSLLSKVHVWYASYGSNIWGPRFMCYIKGGQVQSMRRPCTGSKDKSFLNEISWTTVPHRLFFGRLETHTWGPGGVAFLNPARDANQKAHICMYKITLEQFNDVLWQENGSSCDLISPVVDSSVVDSLALKRHVVVEALKGGWYSNLILLGTKDGLPILSMTCPTSDVDGFRNGSLPLCPPGDAYKDCLLQGLTEGQHLTKDEAIDYLDSAVTMPL